MKLKDFADSLNQKMDAMALPGWTYHVEYDTSLMDSVHIKFADQPKDKWENGIWYNANNFLLMVDERGRSRERGVGPYQMQVSLLNNLPRLVGKSGTLEQIEKHIMSYLARLKNPPAPKPALTPDKVVESLLESNGAASFAAAEEAADNEDDYCVWAYPTGTAQAREAIERAKEIGVEVEPLSSPLSELNPDWIKHVPNEIKNSKAGPVRLCWAPILGGEALELEDALKELNIFAETESVLD